MKNAIKFSFCTLMVITLGACPKPGTLTTKPEPREDKTAVFFVLAQDSGVFDKSINYWSKLEKTADNVHIFTPPAAKDKVESLLGTKYFVDANNLAQKIADTIVGIEAQRILLFIATHGLENGFCYPNSSSCNLTEDFLIDALNPQIKNTNLKQFLIISRACFQKPVLDRFAKKAENYQWPFQIAFTEQKFVESCSGWSFANILLDNLFSSIDRIVTDDLDKFLEIRNLEDLLTFYNNFVREQFELRKLAPGNINLDDFGFNIRINKRIFNDYEDPQIFPFNKTVHDFLANFPLAKHLYKNIASMTFRVPSEKEKDTWIEAPPIPVKGNPSTILDEKNLENKEFIELIVTLSRKPEI